MAKGLIIAPGLDKWLLKYAIKEINAPHVAFLATEATLPLIQEIINKDEISSYKIFFIKNIFSTVETIQEFFNALNWLTKDKGITDIWVDATNCITVIEMATYTSASLIDIFKDVLGEDIKFTLVYINADYKVDEDGIAKEVPGTEKLIEIERPMDSLSFVLALDGLRTFNNHRYDETKEIFISLSENTTGDKSILYSGLGLLADGYDLWDKLDVSHSLERLKKSRENLEKVKNYGLVKEILSKLSENMDVLDKLSKESEINIILDLYCNALRRINEKRFDDALARFYSCLEKITQYELKKFGIDPSNPDYSKLDKEIVEKFTKQLGFLPVELELKKNALLLLFLKDGVGEEIQKKGYKVFTGLIGIRNSSILAHGTKPVNEKNILDFASVLIEPILNKFMEINNINKEEIEKHKHLEIKDLTGLFFKKTHFPLA